LHGEIADRRFEVELSRLHAALHARELVLPNGSRPATRKRASSAIMSSIAWTSLACAARRQREK